MSKKRNRYFWLALFALLLAACGPVTVAPPATVALTPAPLALKTLSPLMKVGKGAVSELAISVDGRWLAIATLQGVYLYETTTQREVWFRTFDNQPQHLAFRPDSAYLAVGQAGNLLPIVDTRNGETTLTLQGQPYIHGTWSPDGKSILTSSSCEQVLIWDAQTGQVTHTILPENCPDVMPQYIPLNATWSGDGKHIYVTTNGDLFAWNVATYQPLESFKLDHSLFDVGFGYDIIPSPTQSLFFIDDGISVHVIDGETGKLVRTFESQADFTWSRDGKRLIALGYEQSFIWNVESDQIVPIAKKYYIPANFVWMPDDETMVGQLVDYDTISAINLVTGKLLFSLGGFYTWHTAGWDGKNLLTYNGINETLWNPTNGQMLAQYTRSEPSWFKAEPETHSPDGLMVLSSDASDTKLKKKLAELHDKLINNKLTWSPDGKRLLSDQPDDDLPPVIWDTQTGEAVLRLDFANIALPAHVNTLEWSPDGKWIVCGSLINNFDDGFAALWDAQTGKQIAFLTDKRTTERIYMIAWSPDQRWLAVSAFDSGKIFLWDLQTHGPVAVLIGHAGAVVDLNWSPDSKLLASSGDSTVLVWMIP